MTTRPSERDGPVARIRQTVARIHGWQPVMPWLYFSWLGDVPFVVLCLGLAVVGRDDAYKVTMGCLLAGSVVAQARYAANRIRRGQRRWRAEDVGAAAHPGVQAVEHPLRPVLVGPELGEDRESVVHRHPLRCRGGAERPHPPPAERQLRTVCDDGVGRIHLRAAGLAPADVVEDGEVRWVRRVPPGTDESGTGRGS